MTEERKRKGKPWVMDLSVIIGFSIIALAFTLGRAGTHFRDYVFLSSDAANIASFTAALDHPQLFVHDPLLKNPANFAFYNTVHVPLIRLLGRVSGNYGSAFVLLIFPFTFLHLLGYYLLGKTLWTDRILSLFFTLTVMVPIDLNLERWGLTRDVLPRFLFQAILPFLLFSVIKWGKAPKSWPWLMGGASLLVYAHPVSLPSWGLAVFLGLWFLAPETPRKQKAFYLIISALLFAVVIAPFAINYLSTTAFGAEGGANYGHILNIMRRRLEPGFMDLKVGFKTILTGAVLSHWLNKLFFALAFLGGIGVFFSRRSSKNPTPLVLSAWWVGIFTVGALIPIADHSLAAALKRMPLEVDLIRSLRYIIPLLLLSVFYLLSELRRIVLGKKAETAKPLLSAGIMVMGLCLMLGWMWRYRFFQNPVLTQTARWWSSGRLVGPLPDEKILAERVEMLQAVRSKTPPGSSLLGADMSSLTHPRNSLRPDANDLAIRYYCFRALVFSNKDGGAFSYANHGNLLTWWRQLKEIGKLKKLKPRKIFLDALVQYSRNYRTDFLVLAEKYNPKAYYPPGLKMIFTNPGYSLYQLVN